MLAIRLYACYHHTTAVRLRYTRTLVPLCTPIVILLAYYCYNAYYYCSINVVLMFLLRAARPVPLLLLRMRLVLYCCTTAVVLYICTLHLYGHLIKALSKVY